MSDEEPNIDGTTEVVLPSTTMENDTPTPAMMTETIIATNQHDGDELSSSPNDTNGSTKNGVDDDPIKETNIPSSTSDVVMIATDTVLENGNETVTEATGTTSTMATAIEVNVEQEEVEKKDKDHLQPVEEEEEEAPPKLDKDEVDKQVEIVAVENRPNNNNEDETENENVATLQPFEQEASKMEDSEPAAALSASSSSSLVSTAKKRSLEEATSTDNTHDEKKKTVHHDEKTGDGNDDDETTTTTAKKPKQQTTGGKKHLDPKVLEIRHIIQSCCQHNDLATAMEAYERAVKEGISIEAQSFYNLLSLGDGLERSVHIGTPKVPPRTNHKNKKANGATATGGMEEDGTASATEAPPKEIRPVRVEKRKEFAFQIKQHMDDIKLPLTETAYTALIRLLSRTRDLDAAMKLVEEAEHVQQCKPKLRLYSSLLLAYCEMGELEQALALRKHIQQHHSTTTTTTTVSTTTKAITNPNQKQPQQNQNQQPLVLTEKECTALLQCAMANDNAIVFEGILSDLAEDVMVPSKDTVAVLLEWFVSPCSKLRRQRLPPRRMSNEQDTTATLNKIKQLLEEGHSHNHPIEVTSNNNNNDHSKQENGNGSGDGAVAGAGLQSSFHEPPPNMGPVVTPNGWKTSSSIPIDTTTGILQRGCLKGCALQPVQVSDRAWQEMTRMNESIVLDGKISGNLAAMFQGGKKGKLRNDFSPATRHGQWSKFCTFLKELETKDRKPHVVLDGANIGYYQQNFSGAPKHVDYYQIDWIVRHFLTTLNQNVLLVMHQRHFAPNLMPAKFQPLVEDWERLGVLYKTPPGMNDDWFWLHAALTYKTLVVTNDEMRDHHFQMLAPRMFLRWKDRHQVHFNFGDWVNEQSPAKEEENKDSTSSTSCSQSTKKRTRQVQLVYPEVYSRRIQRVEDGLVVPLAKRGDTNRFLDGAHEANDDEPREETYLCIRPAPPPPEAKVDWN